MNVGRSAGSIVKSKTANGKVHRRKHSSSSSSVARRSDATEVEELGAAFENRREINALLLIKGPGQRNDALIRWRMKRRGVLGLMDDGWTMDR